MVDVSPIVAQDFYEEARIFLVSIPTMASSQLNAKIVAALNVLEALYFFIQSASVNEARLVSIRNSFESAPRTIRLGLLRELRNEIKWVRKECGAISRDGEFVTFFNKLRREAHKGQVFIPKWEIERRWFSNFSRIFVRWPYIKDHAMVIYDPRNLGVTNQLFELEGALFRDATVLLEEAQKFHKGIQDFRRRARADQFLLHTYLRTTATVIFHFLEAYLNGLAFDCLHRYHNQLSERDHDFLAEWNRQKSRRSFVSTNRKIFRYPLIFAKHLRVKLDLSGSTAAHFLATDAKEMRDALAHPSPHIDTASQTLKKIGLIAGVTFESVRATFQASKEYAVTVENALFGRPEETAPWLFRRRNEG